MPVSAASPKFASLVDQATSGAVPYPYQERLAEVGLPDVLRVPTGAGKTMAAVLPWLYRRRKHPDPEVRHTTPHWLVIVLPQRALVEQTVNVTVGWLHNLGLTDVVGLHTLMGGVDRDDRVWRTDPARERIFVGTQDLVLSRLLMRGFAEGRSSWPMSFGLLNSGVQFVFDEVQLMGPALPTSLQLQGLRAKLQTAAPCRSMWMSATVDMDTLSTPDNREPKSVVELSEDDRRGSLATRLDATRTVTRFHLDADVRRYPRALAERVLAEHRPDTRTLVVLNTVDRATAVYDQLRKATPRSELVLLHSRFRPADRRAHTEEALADGDRIVVTTQVLEAGVDVTSATLVTELAPWSSIVQRAGRCNRDGHATDARLLWTPPPEGRGAERPYEADRLAHAAEVLERLDGLPATSTDLQEAATDLDPPVHPMLRRRDLLDLFDTAPDLGGNDIDVSPFVRDADDRTVMVAWRDFAALEQPAAARDELCPAPLGAVRELVKDPKRAQVFDQAKAELRNAQPADVRPTAVIFLDAAGGGYLPELGFAPSSRTPVTPLNVAPQRPDAVDADPQSIGSGRWVPLAEHLGDVERAIAGLLDEFGPLPGLTGEQRAAAALAGRFHDLGKAHPTFQSSLEKASVDHPPPAAGGPWAKSRGTAPLRHQPRYFRHELASALLVDDAATGLLDGHPEPELITYLVLAHHGKVRLTVRARLDEKAGCVLGVEDGGRSLEASLPDGAVVPSRPLSLAAIHLGAGSLTARALALRDRADLGPFRLAFLEAVVRGGDWRASVGYGDATR